MKSNRLLLVLGAAVMVSACVHRPLPSGENTDPIAVENLKEAQRATLSAEQRAALCLDSAARAHARISSNPGDEASRRIYNKAVADLTVLLRSGADGRMWNRPVTLASGGVTRRLAFAKGGRDGVWDPDVFTGFVPADEVKKKSIKRENHQDGFGGALVGVRKTQPLEPFSPSPPPSRR
jgi:hypothetical protein